MLSKSNNSNCEGQYMISDEEIIDERCGHVIKDSKDDNKCVECSKMYEPADTDCASSGITTNDVQAVV